MNNDIMEATNRIAFKTKQGKISIDAFTIVSFFMLITLFTNLTEIVISLSILFVTLFLLVIKWSYRKKPQP